MRDVLRDVFYFLFKNVEVIGKWFLLVICISDFENFYVNGILSIIVLEVVVVMVLVICRSEKIVILLYFLEYN